MMMQLLLFLLLRFFTSYIERYLWEACRVGTVLYRMLVQPHAGTILQSKYEPVPRSPPLLQQQRQRPLLRQFPRPLPLPLHQPPRKQPPRHMVTTHIPIPPHIAEHTTPTPRSRRQTTTRTTKHLPQAPRRPLPHRTILTTSTTRATSNHTRRTARGIITNRRRTRRRRLRSLLTTVHTTTARSSLSRSVRWLTQC